MCDQSISEECLKNECLFIPLFFHANIKMLLYWFLSPPSSCSIISSVIFIIIITVSTEVFLKTYLKLQDCRIPQWNRTLVNHSEKKENQTDKRTLSVHLSVHNNEQISSDIHKPVIKHLNPQHYPFISFEMSIYMLVKKNAGFRKKMASNNILPF